MKEKPSFYATLPANIRYAEDLSTFQKILYAEITSLSNKEGFCRASNSYFSEVFAKTPRQIKSLINDMKEKGYFDTEIDKGKGNVRKIIIGELHLLRKNIKVPGKANLMKKISLVPNEVA